MRGARRVASIDDRIERRHPVQAQLPAARDRAAARRGLSRVPGHARARRLPSGGGRAAPRRAGRAGRRAAAANETVATLDRAALIALARRAPHRARNLLRWFIRRHGLAVPSTARLAAMQDQLVNAAGDAQVRLAHAGAEIGIHRGRIVVHPPPVPRYAVRWDGAASLALPHGTLEFGVVAGCGLAAAATAAAAVVVRPREGGERIRLAGNRPRQPLKRLLQEAGVPAWQREDWPLVWCGDVLAAVPGIGVAADCQAAAGDVGYDVRWRPQPGAPD